jgi:hypothetical protein
MDFCDSCTDDSFYLTLVSNLCTDIYVKNTNSDFRNYLWRPIVLDGEYYCGVVSIDYADDFTYRRVIEHPQFPDFPSSKKPTPVTPRPTEKPEPTEETGYFLGEQGENVSVFGSDNKATVKIESINQISLKKEDEEDWTNFLSKFKVTLNRQPIVKVKTEYDGKSLYPTVVLTVDDPKNEEYFLKISEELSTFLGFENQTIFYAGKYEAPNKVSEEGYLSINPGKVTCFLNRWITRSVSLSEPKTDPSEKAKFLEEVVQDIVLSLNDNGFGVSMPISPDGVLTVELEDIKPPIKFKLPKELNKILGLDEDYFFDKNVEIYLDEREKPRVPHPSEVELEREKIINAKISNQLFILCEIIDSSSYGPTVRPILRNFVRERGIRISHFREFLPVQYHKVTIKELKEIRICLTDANFIPIREVLYPTTIVLKFVRHKYF